jgi:hypothetical protein
VARKSTPVTEKVVYRAPSYTPMEARDWPEALGRLAELVGAEAVLPLANLYDAALAELSPCPPIDVAAIASFPRRPCREAIGLLRSLVDDLLRTADESERLRAELARMVPLIRVATVIARIPLWRNLPAVQHDLAYIHGRSKAGAKTGAKTSKRANARRKRLREHAVGASERQLSGLQTAINAGERPPENVETQPRHRVAESVMARMDTDPRLCEVCGEPLKSKKPDATHCSKHRQH